MLFNVILVNNLKSQTRNLAVNFSIFENITTDGLTE